MHRPHLHPFAIPPFIIFPQTCLLTLLKDPTICHPLSAWSSGTRLEEHSLHMCSRGRDLCRHVWNMQDTHVLLNYFIKLLHFIYIVLLRALKFNVTLLKLWSANIWIHLITKYMGRCLTKVDYLLNNRWHSHR